MGFGKNKNILRRYFGSNRVMDTLVVTILISCGPRYNYFFFKSLVNGPKNPLVPLTRFFVFFLGRNSTNKDGLLLEEVAFFSFFVTSVITNTSENQVKLELDPTTFGQR